MTFANRKVARIARQQAEAGKTFKYRVRCDAFHIPGGGEYLGFCVLFNHSVVGVIEL